MVMNPMVQIVKHHQKTKHIQDNGILKGGVYTTGDGSPICPIVFYASIKIT